MSVRILVAGASLAMLLLSPASRAQQASAPAAPVTAAPLTAATPPAAAPASPDASEGKVAYYGRKFQGRKTANGERFDASALTMAHKTLPFGTMVRVTHLKNKRSVVVRVNDRGPSTADRIGDLSLAAASRLHMVRAGVAEVRLDVVGAAKPRKSDSKKA